MNDIFRQKGEILRKTQKKLQTAQKSIAHRVKCLEDMQQHYQKVEQDSTIDSKKKKCSLRRGRKKMKKAKAAIARFRKEEDEREKKIRKIESQMFCFLRKCK